jgi:hypothetical protein
MKMSIMQLIQGDRTPDTTESDPLNANGDTMDKAQFDALMAEVAAIKAAPSITEAKVTEIVNAAVKPVVDAQAARDAAEAAKSVEEHAALVNSAVEAGLLTEALAKASPAPVLSALIANAKTPPAAFRVNGAFQPNNTAERKPLALKGE